MIATLEKTLLGAGGKPIRVDIDELWRKAVEDSHEEKRRARHDAIEPLDDMGEFAVISAWARGKGKKG